MPAQQLKHQKEARKLRQRQIERNLEHEQTSASVPMQGHKDELKHYQTPQVRPRVSFATTESEWLRKHNGDLATPFTPGKL